MNLSELIPAKYVEAFQTVNVPVFFKGRLMGSDRYYVVAVKRNKKSVTLITSDGNLRIAKNTLVRIESEDE